MYILAILHKNELLTFRLKLLVFLDLIERSGRLLHVAKFVFVKRGT